MTTLGEELEEVPEEVDQLLLRPLCGNQEEQKEEEELGKEGAVKERKERRKKNVPFLVQLDCCS